jgi:hypothetical protein
MVFWRVTFTGLVAWVGFQAVLMASCASVDITAFAGWACVSRGAGLVSGPAAAMCLGMGALAVLGLTWIRPYRRHREASATTTTLSANLHRLDGFATALDPVDPSTDDGEQTTTPEGDVSAPEPSITSPVDDASAAVPDAPEDRGLIDHTAQVVDCLTKQVHTLADRVTSGSVKPQDVFWEWLTLVKDLNRSHSDQLVPTEAFARLNTRLLDLIPHPQRPVEPRREVAPFRADSTDETVTIHPEHSPDRESTQALTSTGTRRLPVPSSWE